MEAVLDKRAHETGIGAEEYLLKFAQHDIWINSLHPKVQASVRGADAVLPAFHGQLAGHGDDSGFGVSRWEIVADLRTAATAMPLTRASASPLTLASNV